MDDLIKEFMDQKKFAVVGATDNPEKYGHQILENLKKRDYDVYPVNPRLETIEGMKCYATLSDLPVKVDVVEQRRFDLDTSEGITDAVFRILRNADIVTSRVQPRLVVCWGGHSISRTEYDFTKEVGYQLGLRGMDIATGCGPGAMKGPMKGAAIGHNKQRIRRGRYVGLTEPGIIAAESPNPIVNELVILPDIEKRLEAFVRTGHGITVFPGGVGTAEEVLYVLGVLMNPANRHIPFPLILSGPACAADYLHELDAFIRFTLFR